MSIIGCNPNFHELSLKILEIPEFSLHRLRTMTCRSLFYYIIHRTYKIHGIWKNLVGYSKWSCWTFFVPRSIKVNPKLEWKSWSGRIDPLCKIGPSHGLSFSGIFKAYFASPYTDLNLWIICVIIIRFCHLWFIWFGTKWYQ